MELTGSITWPARVRADRARPPHPAGTGGVGRPSWDHRQRHSVLAHMRGGNVAIIRVGMVGAGWIAQEHRRALDSAADAELTAVCDIDRERAENLAAGTGARIYLDWRDLLDREDIGALIVCTPPRAHREPAVAALSHGVPVYLEKPIARTPEDAAEIVAVAARTGAVCAVGYQWHALDLLEDLPGAIAGEVVAVQAAASRVRLARSAGEAGDIDDALTIMLELASGALATVVVAWTRPGQPGTYGLDIIASEATLRLALDPDFTLSGVSRGQPVARRAASHPFQRSVRRFLDAVSKRDPAAVACTPPDAAATLAVATAAERALQTSRAIQVGTF